MASEENQVPDSSKYYEDRKHRRYRLLFAVNGGAFAIAKMFAEKTRLTFDVERFDAVHTIANHFQ